MLMHNVNIPWDIETVPLSAVLCHNVWPELPWTFHGTLRRCHYQQSCVTMCGLSCVGANAEVG